MAPPRELIDVLKGPPPTEDDEEEVGDEPYFVSCNEWNESIEKWQDRQEEEEEKRKPS